MLLAEVIAAIIQTDFGRVDVRNVEYKNYNDINIRAKLFKPVGVTSAEPAPGIVYTHGYQNNRETSDPYCIEMARRGFVALCIDAIGRGNSGNPNSVTAPDFDSTYGVRSIFKNTFRICHLKKRSSWIDGSQPGIRNVLSGRPDGSFR